MGWRNADVEFTDKQLLDNIKKMQVDGNIPQSKLLVKQDGLGACSLDIEMETGTGKTYVYIKTMFEMNYSIKCCNITVVRKGLCKRGFRYFIVFQG